jgi:arginine N-succinyltransferase
MMARTDRVRTVRDAKDAAVVAIDREGGEEAIVSTGRLADFRAAYARVRPADDGIVMSPDGADALGLSADDRVTWVPRV